MPHRTVVILKDKASPLYYLRCQHPCGVDKQGGWCHRHPFEPLRPGICWSASAPTEEGCYRLASRYDYTVVEAAPHER